MPSVVKNYEVRRMCVGKCVLRNGRHDRNRDKATKKGARRFTVVSFVRVEPEEPQLLAWEEAMGELRHLEFLCPDDIHRIEEVEA